jgi:heme/copper-type cytochrome/quinol oxidase subunit 2
MEDQMTTYLAVLVCIMVGCVMYMLPTLVAAKRQHHNATAITVLNIFAGWTVLGWLIALVWSFTSRPLDRP